jgi:glutathione S-transferase
MTIDFYYALLSLPCRSVLLVAKALGVELNLKKVSLKDDEHKRPEFLKVRNVL